MVPKSDDGAARRWGLISLRRTAPVRSHKPRLVINGITGVRKCQEGAIIFFRGFFFGFYKRICGWLEPLAKGWDKRWQSRGGVSNNFLHLSFNAFPLSVIPAKAGIQIRNVAFDCAFLVGFPSCFPVRDPLDPRFFGDDKGGGSDGRFESQGRKTIDLLHAHLRIEPFNDRCKRL